jgi:hypothetical protein
MDYAAFIAALEASGAVVEELEVVDSSLFSGEGHSITVDGQNVSVFEYETVEELQAQVALIGADGGTVTDASGAVAIVDWVDIPHFFQVGRIMVFYAGREPGIEATISAITGPQFAGGDPQAWGLVPFVSDFESLTEALSAQGLTVEPADALEAGFFSVGGMGLVVNGQDIQVYQFADEQSAIDAAATVSPDGGTIGSTPLRWAAPPHFYRTGMVIVLYVGSDQPILDALTAVLGEQFAGS